MPRSVYSLEHYRFSKTDNLFLDTNVWLCNYAKNRFRNPRADDYQHAVKRINKAQCQVYVDHTVVSEFIYVCTNEAVKGNRFRNRKAFRQSPAFAEAMGQIEEDVEEILTRCHYLDSDTDSPQAIRDIISDCKAGQMDYNDHIIARVCATHGSILVTDDADFAKFAKQKPASKIRILTANPQLLQTRK